MQSAEARGSIYDLGYRRYEGARLGRRAALLELYFHSLRTAFGFGRGARAKIIPIGLAIITLIPAVIQLGIAAVASGIVELYRAENYYGYIEVSLVLFTASAAPELVGRDQRDRVLSLYFSRPLLRSDYAGAKFAALASALGLLTIGPQLVLMVGNARATNNAGRYLADNAGDLLPIVLAGAVISGLLAAIGLAVASQTPRRSWAAGGIVALVFIPAGLAAGIAEDNLGGGSTPYLVLGSFLHVVRGATYLLFGETPSVFDSGRGYHLALAEVETWHCLVAALAIAAAALALVWRRYQRIAA